MLYSLYECTLENVLNFVYVMCSVCVIPLYNVQQPNIRRVLYSLYECMLQCEGVMYRYMYGYDILYIVYLT